MTAIVVLAIVGMASWPALTSVGADAAGRPASVALSAEPSGIDVVGLPCMPSAVTLFMSNTTDSDIYADSIISADEPLSLSRQVFSSWLPAGDPDILVGAEMDVTVPRYAPPGTYPIDVRSGHSRLTIPVEVQQAPPKGPGDNLARGEHATASSTHPNFAVCAAVDGDADSASWESTGWNDGTRTVFPDTFDVQLAESAALTRVELHTLDSARYPGTGFALRDWDVQVHSAAGWETVAEVRGNVDGHVTSSFSAVLADAVRIIALASNDGAYSRIVELEVYAD